MDFDPAEIRRMMEKRQRELNRNTRSTLEDVLSPSKRSRQEKENSTESTRSPQKQGSLPESAGPLPKVSSSVRARLSEVSKRLAQFEDDFPRRSTAPMSPPTPEKRRTELTVSIPRAQMERRRSPGGSKKLEQIPKVKISSTLPKSNLVPLGNIFEEVSKFDVETSTTRSEIDAKPMASVLDRAKFFEKAIEADKTAADAVAASISRRSSKVLKEDQKPVNRMVSSTVEVKSPTERAPEEPSPSLPKSPGSSDRGGSRDEAQMHVTHAEVAQEPPRQEQPEHKKVGTVSSKLKSHLQDLMVNGHKCPDDTLMSISEKAEQHPPLILPKFKGEGEQEVSELQPEVEQTTSLLVVEEPSEILECDADSKMTEFPGNAHSTPCASLAESLETSVTRTVSLNESDENEAHRRQGEVAELRMDTMQEVNQDEPEGTPGEKIEDFKRDLKNRVALQESFMKQFSHALKVCQERGDQGSKEHLEAERFLLIATKRHHLAQAELQRINAERSLPQTAGTLAISQIKLPFKNEFLELMRQCNNLLEKTHYFMVLVRSGDLLVHTGLASSNDEILERSARFVDSPGLSLDIREDSEVVVEVYAVQASNPDHPDCRATSEKIRREKEKESKKGGGILSVLTPSKKKKASSPPLGGDVKIRRPSFGLIGRLTLDENMINRNERWYRLSDFYEDSPLDGRIHVKLQLTVPEKVYHCGTVRLNDGFITSYFAAIEGSHLKLYKDMRSAEEDQEPARCFELTQAVDIVRVEQISNFHYFPLKLSDGVELRFLTYSEHESKEWAHKLNARISRYLKK